MIIEILILISLFFIDQFSPHYYQSIHIDQIYYQNQLNLQNDKKFEQIQKNNIFSLSCINTSLPKQNGAIVLNLQIPNQNKLPLIYTSHSVLEQTECRQYQCLDNLGLVQKMFYPTLLTRNRTIKIKLANNSWHIRQNSVETKLKWNCLGDLCSSSQKVYEFNRYQGYAFQIMSKLMVGQHYNQIKPNYQIFYENQYHYLYKHGINILSLIYLLGEIGKKKRNEEEGNESYFRQIPKESQYLLALSLNFPGIFLQILYIDLKICALINMILFQLGQGYLQLHILQQMSLLKQNYYKSDDNQVVNLFIMSLKVIFGLTETIYVWIEYYRKFIIVAKFDIMFFDEIVMMQKLCQGAYFSYILFSTFYILWNVNKENVKMIVRIYQYQGVYLVFSLNQYFYNWSVAQLINCMILQGVSNLYVLHGVQIEKQRIEIEEKQEENKDEEQLEMNNMYQMELDYEDEL